MTVTGRREDGMDEPEHLIVPALFKRPGEAPPPWACSCNLPTYRRHRQESDCYPADRVAAFRRAHPTIKTDGVARALMFIESFAPRSR